MTSLVTIAIFALAADNRLHVWKEFPERRCETQEQAPQTALELLMGVLGVLSAQPHLVEINPDRHLYVAFQESMSQDPRWVPATKDGEFLPPETRDLFQKARDKVGFSYTHGADGNLRGGLYLK